jgi:uncharacterized membrane protein YkoI
MKFINTISILLAVGLVLGASHALAGVNVPQKLAAKAKITQAQAEKIALDKVPNGTIKEGELEKEHGQLVWSFDIATPGSQDIAEVQVNAKTGKIVTVETETPAQQAKENQEEAKGKAARKEDLAAKAKVTQAEAEKTALAKVPNGTIKEGELEKEHGKLVWSFDIATPGSQDITEVQVNAKTGKIVTVETETPAQQAREKQADAREKADGKDKD